MSDGIRQRNVAAPTESKKPDNSAFKQQRLPAWQPVLTAKSVLPIFAIVGLIFIPVGVLIIVASNEVIEHEVVYTECTAYKYWYGDNLILQPAPGQRCIDIYNNWRESLGTDATLGDGNPPTCVCHKSFNVDKQMEDTVFAYYRLTDYYQNHRRYVKSRDDVQLLAGKEALVSKHQDCDPYDQFDGKPIAPCGAIANSLFNDTFFLIKCPTGGNGCIDPTEEQLQDPANIPDRLIMSGENIAWSTDKTRKFDPDGKTSDVTQEPDGSFKNINYLNETIQPINWRTTVATLGTDRDALKYRFDSGTSGVGFKNEDFIVWMRTAAFPTFRKLYRKIVNEQKDPVPVAEGTYQLLIYYNYPVHTFGGGKYFVIATTSWIGGKNLFLGYTYTIVGGLCFIVMFILLCISRRNNNAD